MSYHVAKNYNAFKNKHEIHLFVRKVHRFLHANHTIKFIRLSDDCVGKMWPDENPATILLDKRFHKHTHNNPVSTLIHEVLHFVYQDASETWVRKMEPRIFKQLSHHQIRYMETLLLRYM